MIIEAIFNTVFNVVDAIIFLLPSIGGEIPEGVTSATSSLFSGIGYVFPVIRLMPILLMSLSLDSFRFIMAIISRVKSFIPTWGN